MCYDKKKVVADIKKAPGLMGGLPIPSSYTMCDLVECCNYYNPGPPDGIPEYGDFVGDKFQGMEISNAIAKCCGDYSAKYTACTIDGQVHYIISGCNINCNMYCCEKAYLGYSCNVDVGYINIAEGKRDCCDRAVGWTCYLEKPGQMPESAINNC